MAGKQRTREQVNITGKTCQRVFSCSCNIYSFGVAGGSVGGWRLKERNNVLVGVLWFGVCGGMVGGVLRVVNDIERIGYIAHHWLVL